ncbi:hypothetical protein FRX31_026553 [Thalictrum thalictroides]|uniref:Uncharacterized protein n=1 Tax=Thalictrum thalictroides TaxID=46969 RepID=A0A7J6VI41_THATH|nr:hypothetical protein FRX31_026553 [Thalictrum thalictroides]
MGYCSSSSTHNDFKITGLDFPCFDGCNVRGWIRQASRYFLFNPIASIKMVSFASMHFKGKVDMWFQSYYDQFDGIDWVSFTVAIKARFSEEVHENIVTDINHLQQQNSPFGGNQNVLKDHFSGEEVHGGLLEATEVAIAKGSIPSVRSQVSIKFSLESSSTSSLKKFLQYNSDTQSLDLVYMIATSYVTPKTIDMPGYSSSGHFTTKQLDKQLGCPLRASSKLWVIVFDRGKVLNMGACLFSERLGFFLFALECIIVIRDTV